MKLRVQGACSLDKAQGAASLMLSRAMEFEL